MRNTISRTLLACLLALNVLPIASIAAEADTPRAASYVPSASSASSVSSASSNRAAGAAHAVPASSPVPPVDATPGEAPSAATPLAASSAVPGSAAPDPHASAAQSASVITPADARRAVAVLQNGSERAQAVNTLKAIAAVSPSSMPVYVSPPTVVSVPAAAPAAASSAAAAAPSSAASSTATAPIRANGLIAQLLRQVAHWADGLADQLHKLGQVIVGLPAFSAWLVHTFGTPYGQQLAIKSVTALAAVFVAGLLVEWALRRILRRPRSALIDHADALEKRVRERAVREAQLRRQKLREARQAAAEREAAEQAAQAAEAAAVRQANTASAKTSGRKSPGASPVAPATTSSAAAGNATDARSSASLSDGDDQAARAAQDAAVDKAAVDQANAAAAGMGDGQSDVALVRTQVDGVERVEAVRVDAGDGASGGAAVEAVAAAADSAAPTDAEEAADEEEAAIPVRSAEHWSTLRHLPFALGALALDLLPLLLFFIVAGLVLRWLAGESGAIQDMTEGFVNAYIVTRVTMAVIRLLVSPVGHGLRVLRVSPEMSRTVEEWVRRIVVLGAFGVALTNGAGAMGASHSGQVAFMKLVSLLVHSFTVVLIFRTRRPVGALISAKPDADGPVATIRNWLADVWAIFAGFVVMAVWVVWALGVEDGFPKLIHFIGVSVGVIVLARLAAILLLGALGRAFHPDAKDAAQAGTTSRLANRYYPIVRAVVSAIIIVCSIIGLFEVWGFNAIGWFTRGPVGRNLTSAALTIAVAVVVAVAVWESANMGVERRLARWAERGDTVRAARLRTLLPMLRTCLFICILLMVGLTALNEIGINTTPLLAGASIIGVALGFGSQKLVQDFITGIFLLMENAMQVGDYVTVAGVSGSVEYLSIRTVRLRASDGSLFIVPFSSVTTVNNINRGLGNASVKVSVAYNSDIDQVIDELKAIGTSIREDASFADLTLGDLELWGVDSVDGSMVTIAGQIRCLDKGRWGVQREFNRRMFERFRELGIEIANPRATWVLPSGSAPGLPGADAETEAHAAQPKAPNGA